MCSENKKQSFVSSPPSSWQRVIDLLKPCSGSISSLMSSGVGNVLLGTASTSFDKNYCMSTTYQARRWVPELYSLDATNWVPAFLEFSEECAFSPLFPKRVS